MGYILCVCLREKKPFGAERMKSIREKRERYFYTVIDARKLIMHFSLSKLCVLLHFFSIAVASPSRVRVDCERAARICRAMAVPY